jgi:hypothetical protein
MNFIGGVRMNIYWMQFGLVIGIAVGGSIGYKEIEKKIKTRLLRLYKNDRLKCLDQFGNELSYQNMIKLLFPRRHS